MVSGSDKTVWELLWDYDPNALVAFNRELKIQLVNPAFCELFRTSREQVIGSEVTQYLEDPADFGLAWDSEEIIRRERHYERYDLYVKKVLFAIPAHDLMACIMVDITHEWKQKQELLRLKQETLRNVDLVVDKQMKVAQEIASLLGETTAQTKVNLLRLRELLQKGEL